MTIKAIETIYNGHCFRSRLEARWAVFFDSLGIPYQYEPEGFKVSTAWSEGNSEWYYLPDFYLPKLGAWVEVKGSLDNVTDDYLEMIAHAIDWGGALPGVKDSAGTGRGLLWLGPIPSESLCSRGAPTHLIFQHSKGGWLNRCGFRAYDYRTCFSGVDRCEVYFDSSCGLGACAKIFRPVLKKYVYDGDAAWDWPCPHRVFGAYRAARFARFEHNERRK